MTTILQFLIQSIPIFLAIAIPGFLLALGLLRKTKLHLWEIAIIGIPIGMSVPAILAFLESFIGIQFTAQLVLINLAITTIAGVFLLIKEKPKIMPEKIHLTNVTVPILLFIILFLAFWIRIQALSPYFYDFDPYWYNALTQFILTEGSIPQNDDLSWYPNLYSHRGLSHVQYISAGWYHIYSMFNGIQHFDFDLMTMISSLYPPIVAALMCFFAYLWFSREYNKQLGLIAACILAFTPSIVDKMLAGSFELAPWGFFTIIFFYATYYLTLKEKSKRLALLSSFALFVSLIGAPAAVIPNALLAAVVIILSIYYFFKDELSSEFVLLNAIVVAGSFIAGILMSIFYGDFSYSYFLSTAALILPLILLQLKTISKTIEDKLIYILVLIVIALAVMFVTPLKGIAESYIGTFLYVTTYTDPTMQTIAEQTAAGSDFSYTLGLLGVNIVEDNPKTEAADNISITPFILLCAAILSILSLISLSLTGLIALIGVYPIALSGLMKAKFTVYLGVMIPIAFCIIIGELWKYLKKYRIMGYALIAFAAIIAIVQFLQYYDLIVNSPAIANQIDVTNNTAFFSSVCDEKTKQIQDAASALSDTSTIAKPIAEFTMKSMVMTRQVYCTRIPDWWLNAILWIRDNRKGDERIFSWWDYGHWTTTIGQGKSVTDNLHSYTLMHQEVADKLVSNTPEALIKYMKEHKAKYLLLDQDLIGKWGALVYHACYYNNKTNMSLGPGRSDCDRLYSPEILYVAKNPTSKDVCNIQTKEGPALKVYSSMSKYYNFNYYCAPGGNLPFVYENGSVVGISNVMLQGETTDGYYILSAVYPSNSPDRKGYYYDSVFYKGFFEGNIPGLTQVYPSIYSNRPNIPVRIYKINE